MTKKGKDNPRLAKNPLGRKEQKEEMPEEKGGRKDTHRAQQQIRKKVLERGGRKCLLI